MKYILVMNGTKANFAEYAKWSKKDMEANVAFMKQRSRWTISRLWSTPLANRIRTTRWSCSSCAAILRLTPASAIALTLRAVGGLTTAEIAHAFLVPEPTMAQRISRAKQSIKNSGIPFQLPTTEERAQRLRAVLHVLYLIFNEGYTSSAGPDSAPSRSVA